MTNTNCLEGMKCPDCGSEGPFRISIEVVVLMHDDGFYTDTLNDATWGDSSYCCCDQCNWAFEVADFKAAAQREIAK